MKIQIRHFWVIFKHYVAFFSSFFSPGFAVFKRGLKRKKERRKWQWEAAILLLVFVDQMVLQCNAIFYVFVTTGKKAEADRGGRREALSVQYRHESLAAFISCLILEPRRLLLLCCYVYSATVFSPLVPDW